MSKREEILLMCKIGLGMAEITDLPLDVIEKMSTENYNSLIEWREMMSEFNDSSPSPKEFNKTLINFTEIAIETLEKEKGEDYTMIDVQQRLLSLVFMTDPENSLSPFELTKPTN